MEFLGCEISFLPIVFATLCIALYLWITDKVLFFKRCGIPGPVPLPLVGNLRLYLKMGGRGADQWLKDNYGRVVGYHTGSKATVNVADPELLKQITVKQFSNFTNRLPANNLFSVTVNSLLGQQDDEWKYSRRMLTPMFSGRKIKLMSSLIKDCISILLTHVEKIAEDKSTVELKELFGGFAMDVIASTAFGLEVDSQKIADDPFVASVKRVTGQSYTHLSILLKLIFPRIARFCARFSKKTETPFLSKVLLQTIKDRRQNKSSRTDLLQMMIHAHEDNVVDDVDKENISNMAIGTTDWKSRGLADDEITSQAVVFLMAGYDTTSSTLAFATYFLATNLDVQERLTQEVDDVLGDEDPTFDKVNKMPYLDMCVSETLRLFPPIDRFHRVTKADINLNGYTFPKDSTITIPIFVIQRDPEFWSDPNTFNPERFSTENKDTHKPYTYAPFGFGPRSCIGSRLALFEVKMAIAYILKRYRFEPSNKTQVPIMLGKGFFCHAENGIWVQVKKR